MISLPFYAVDQSITMPGVTVRLKEPYLFKLACLDESIKTEETINIKKGRKLYHYFQSYLYASCMK